MTLQDIPPINAMLSALSACFLLLGYIAIRHRYRRTHVGLMIAAATCTTAFFVCYIIYHYSVPSRTFPLDGSLLRGVYYAILFTHVPLAILVLPLVIWTFSAAIRRQWRVHRTIARPTFWLWLYVSVTGVLVYTMLYQLPRWIGQS